MAAADDLFRAAVKGLLVAYILLTPVLSAAPVRPFVESTLFVALYACAVVAIAFYDAVAAALLMVVLAIWVAQNSREAVGAVREQLQVAVRAEQEAVVRAEERPRPRVTAEQEAEARLPAGRLVAAEQEAESRPRVTAEQEERPVVFRSRLPARMPTHVEVQQSIDNIEDAVYDAQNARMVVQPLGSGQVSAQGIQQGAPVGYNAFEPTLHAEYRDF